MVTSDFGLVVLAAGKGERLNGVTAPGMKPFLVVNGKPLVTSALDIAPFARSVLVVSPMNAQAAVGLLGGRDGLDFVVQAEATGPAAALVIGLTMLRGRGMSKFIAIMGDNLIDPSAVEAVAEAVHSSRKSPIVVHTHFLADGYERFTRWSNKLDRWVEHEPDMDPETSERECWLGPIGGDIDTVLGALSEKDELISAAFNRCPTMRVTSEHLVLDVGTPDVVTNVTGG